MAPAKRVYGKAPRLRQDPADRIFGENLSSPVAPPHRSCGSSASPKKKDGSPTAASKESTSEPSKLGHGVDNIVDGLQALELHRDTPKEQQVEENRTPWKPNSSGGALQERSINEIVDSPRSVRARKRLQQKESSRINSSPRTSTETQSQVEKTSNRQPSASVRASRQKDSQQPSSTRSGRSRRVKQVLSTEEVSKIPADLDDSYKNHVAPLLKLSNAKPTPTSFEVWSDSLVPLFDVTKIAEASYGEVYRLSLKRQNSRADSALHKTEESVLKLIALKPSENAPGQPKSKAWKERVAGMSDVDDVAGEVRLLRRMTPIPGFTNFRDILVLQGALPKPFVEAWRCFNKNVKESLFPDPGRKNTYPADQLWAVIEMQDAGQDLETLPVDDAYTIWDSFWGVAIAVAKGEEYASFEHRDLHLGNVCVKRIPQKQRRPDIKRTLRFTGIETTIIDYTLSRARMSPCPLISTDEHAAQQEDIAHFDLSKDPCIFAGDEEEDYQYAIYRYMRNAVLQNDPLALYEPLNEAKKARKPSSKTSQQTRAHEQAEWKRFHPSTNVVWLHFILFTLLKMLDSPTISGSRPKLTAKTQEHHDMLLDRLRWMRDTILSLQGLSAGSIVFDEPLKLKSAGELVTWAVSVGWLGESDVVGSDNDSSEIAPDLELSGLQDLSLSKA